MRSTPNLCWRQTWRARVPLKSVQRISAKVGAVEKERSASRVSTTGVVAKGTAEAERAFEVDDAVGALRLYQTFLKDEVAAL